MKFFTNIISIFCLIQSFSAKKEYSSHLPRCYRDDPNLNKCLIKACETLRPLLKDGIREFGIPPMNPLVIPSVTLEQGTQKLNFKMTVKNYTIYGLDNFTVNVFNIDLEKKNLNIEILFEPLTSHGKCNFEGKVYSTSLMGRGTLIIDTAPTTLALGMELDIIQKHGKEYIQIHGVKLFDGILKGKARFENFEGVDENIVKIFNDLIDVNSEELIQEVKPVLNILVEQFINQTLNEVFGRYLYDDILPLSI